MKSSINRWISIWIIIFLFIPQLLFSQGKEANNWYFGGYSGFSFNNGSPPTVLYNGQTDVVGAGSGVASMSDENGNLILYSTGSSIWNREHNYLLNSNNIGTNTTQGAIFVPHPGNPNLLYFFNYAFGGVNDPTFQYSVIDLTLDNGLGGIIPEQKCITLYLHATSHLSAVKHANGTDVWVVSHKIGSNSYYVYQVTTNGIIGPVISNVGSNTPYFQGYLKISPNGKKLATAQYDYSNLSFCEVLDFNPETGVISDENIIHIPNPAFAVEFSPDNSKLYTNYEGTDFYQYDLDAGDAQSVINSKVQLSLENVEKGALQLGPDGKNLLCDFYVSYWSYSRAKFSGFSL